tara:strand:+ start:2034 stop:2534 length:501 start_codon:yes stop_codon:yes gene_type:complete
MKKLLTLLALMGLAVAPQAQVTLGDKIAEAEAGWIVGIWEADLDGNKVSLSFNWAIKDHVLAFHFKGNNSESYSLIALNAETDEVEQTGYDNKGKKSKGSWGPKDDMPMLTLTRKDDNGNDSTMGVAFRRIDQNNIELQIFPVDADGTVADFSEFSFEMNRVKSKK